MQRIIEDTSSNELLAALESNMVAFWSAYGRAGGSTLHATSEVVWFYTGIQAPLFNGVVYANLRPDRVRATFDSLQAMIDGQGAPAMWWIGPRSKPDNLGGLLELQGARPVGEAPGMAMDLALLDNTETITDFTIQKVSNAEMQMLWAQIAGAGTGFPAPATEALARLEATRADPQYKAQPRYIGFLHGAPVAASALVLDAGVAGIYAVATIPGARGQGIGKLMTAAPLLEARQAGYRVGILQASTMGYPLYSKMGFKDVCKYKLYLQS